MNVAIFTRVSTNDQTTDRQTNDLRDLCAKQGWTITHTITETVSGAKRATDRAGIQQLFNLAKSKTIKKVVITEVSRIGRNVAEGVQIIEALAQAGVSLYVGNIGMETLLPDGKQNFMFKPILLTLIGFAEMERELMRERIKSGLATAKKKGKTLGRPEGKESDTETLDKYPTITKAVRAGALSIRKIAKLYDVSPNTVQKVKEAMKRKNAA